MGSFSLKNDDFDEEKNVVNENGVKYGFEKKTYVTADDLKNNYFYKKFNNRTIVIIVTSVIFIVMVNIIMFWLFSNSQSVIEIPENKDFKEYVENSITKEQSIYKLLSKRKYSDSNSPKIIPNTDSNVVSKKFTKNNNTDNSRDKVIDFKNIRNANIDNNIDQNEISIGRKILEIDNNNSLNKVYRLNIGIFLTHDLANDYIQRLKEKYQDLKSINHYIVPVQFKNKVVYKVLIGDFASNDNAEKASDQLDKLEINSSVEEF